MVVPRVRGVGVRVGGLRCDRVRRVSSGLSGGLGGGLWGLGVTFGEF